MRQQRRLPWWLPVAAVQALVQALVLVREPGLARSLRGLEQARGPGLEQARGRAQARLRFVVQWHHRNLGLPWQASNSHHASTTRWCRSSR